MRYVLIGNSAAAVGCVEGIRQVDKKSDIVIISDEPYHTYSRPLISYLLLGTTDQERMKYRGDSFYEDNNVTLLAPHKVVSINPKEKSLALESDAVIIYDKLLVSTGSRPFVPPMSGLENVEKQYSFMTLDQAKALEKSINPYASVLIIGAGLIGLKCAEGILDKVDSISVVDLAPRILSSILDEPGSRIIQRHLEKKGIKFYLNQSVQKFEPKFAALNNGRELAFDILVLAVGVKANVELVKAAGGEVGRGIVVNSKMETNLPDIFAAGDCTESMDITSGTNKVLALLPNAYIQGECAGINMAGGSADFNKAMPLNAIGFFGYNVLTAGSYEGEVFLEQDGDIYRKLFYSTDTPKLLKGFILINSVERAGIYTSLIREKTPLDTLDINMIFKNPDLLAFSRDERKAMLGVIRYA